MTTPNSPVTDHVNAYLLASGITPKSYSLYRAAFDMGNNNELLANPMLGASNRHTMCGDYQISITTAKHLQSL
jgi:hypothetical protein